MMAMTTHSTTTDHAPDVDDDGPWVTYWQHSHPVTGARLVTQKRNGCTRTVPAHMALTR